MSAHPKRNESYNTGDPVVNTRDASAALGQAGCPSLLTNLRSRTQHVCTPLPLLRPGQTLDGRVVVVVEVGSLIRRADGEVDERHEGDGDEGVEEDAPLVEEELGLGLGAGLGLGLGLG